MVANNAEASTYTDTTVAKSLFKDSDRILSSSSSSMLGDNTMITPAGTDMASSILSHFSDADFLQQLHKYNATVNIRVASAIEQARLFQLLAPAPSYVAYDQNTHGSIAFSTMSIDAATADSSSISTAAAPDDEKFHLKLQFQDNSMNVNLEGPAKVSRFFTYTHFFLYVICFSPYHHS
jgi:hypothetical protein